MVSHRGAHGARSWPACCAPQLLTAPRPQAALPWLRSVPHQELGMAPLAWANGPGRAEYPTGSRAPSSYSRSSCWPPSCWRPSCSRPSRSRPCSRRFPHCTGDLPGGGLRARRGAERCGRGLRHGLLCSARPRRDGHGWGGTSVAPEQRQGALARRRVSLGARWHGTPRLARALHSATLRAGVRPRTGRRARRLRRRQEGPGQELHPALEPGGQRRVGVRSLRSADPAGVGVGRVVAGVPSGVAGRRCRPWPRPPSRDRAARRGPARGRRPARARAPHAAAPRRQAAPPARGGGFRAMPITDSD
jgi:hypothetical protein